MFRSNRLCFLATSTPQSFLLFNKAYIVANNENLVLTINRVSGKASMENKSLKTGMCKLTNKTKF